MLTFFSAHLAQNERFLFPRMKKDRKEKRFKYVEEVKEKTTETLKGITSEEL